jgi:pyridoxamine 5'-phosphate oxidase
VDENGLGELRREYAAGGLDEADLTPAPLALFRRWLDQATAAGVHEPNAMVVATVSGEGRPSSRLVLLKGLDDRGFVFYTNYDSRKSTEIGHTPWCALLFPWHPLERQVRVEGPATRLSGAENAAYFATRPRASQLGAWASPQSQVVASRAELDQRYEAVAERFAEGEVPVPPYWGGFVVVPEVVEFWQGRRGRMHDRLRYRRDPSTTTGWTTDRLAP